ncbi:hypothetical protein T265_10434 [Opisthorchis viverrini]|uniref:Uncharacterized protein n=1 Tax=Opisthorchis viverrini TaxID=6198 RepID=A0A075A1D7_OPIVI|nr:hypothetical protein T265_10434 [Opisthorchis viverrini]KER21179.1 hypothetical protein T265_10434 [Opisthorchis viverrini]
MDQWLEREFTDQKVRGSNPTSTFRLLLSRLDNLGTIPALVLPSDGKQLGTEKVLQLNDCMRRGLDWFGYQVTKLRTSYRLLVDRIRDYVCKNKM